MSGRVSSTPDALGRQTRYESDARNRVTRVINPLGDVSTIEFDEAGNVSRQIDALGRATNYEYDGSNRVKRCLLYTYDAADDITRGVRAVTHVR